jgi:hypothetical protein
MSARVCQCLCMCVFIFICIRIYKYAYVNVLSLFQGPGKVARRYLKNQPGSVELPVRWRSQYPCNSRYKGNIVIISVSVDITVLQWFPAIKKTEMISAQPEFLSRRTSSLCYQKSSEYVYKCFPEQILSLGFLMRGFLNGVLPLR